jgi:hypothetical protein
MFDAQQNVVRYCLGYCNPGLCGRERDRHFAAYKKLSKDIWNPTDRPVFSDSRCLVFGRCGCGVKNSNERTGLLYLGNVG